MTPEELEFIRNFGGLPEGGLTPKKPRNAKPRKKPRKLEAGTQRAILDYLRLRPGVFAFRVNSMGVPLQRKSAGMSTAMRFRPGPSPGVSDIIAVSRGKAYFIEVKSPTGRQSDVQKKFEEKVLGAGAVYCLARSVDDVIALGL